MDSGRYLHITTYSRGLLHPVSVDLAVAMIAAAQGDVVIDIEGRPIMTTEVNNNALIKGGRQYFHISFFLLISILCLLPTLQLQAEKVRFSLFTDSTDRSLKILSSSLFSIV